MAKRILIADDSVTIQKAFALTFAGEDVSIALARSADDGLAQARQARPDLIIADGAMPGKTGYDLCAQVRADAALSGVPSTSSPPPSSPTMRRAGRAPGRTATCSSPGTLRHSWKGSTPRRGPPPRSPPHLRAPRAHHRGLAPGLGHGGRLRRDQHRFVRPRDAAADRHRRPGRGRCAPPRRFVAARPGSLAGRPAMRPSLIPGHAPRRHAARAPRHHAGSPAGGGPAMPSPHRACRRDRRRRRSGGR